jgi:VWFA-related protein
MAAHRLVTFTVFLFSAIAAASQGSAQPPTPPPVAVSTLLISARAKGPVVLTVADLEIKEDGKPVRIQQVLKMDLPIRYCVLFDVSGSEHFQFKRQQVTAIQLVEQVIRPKNDLGWFALFSADSKEGKETDNPNDILNAIAGSKAYGGTALYDAIAQCSARMERAARDVRLRVMFLFTDGDDNQSHITRDGAIRTAMGAGLRIYAIGSQNEGQRHGSNVLKAFADNTGGDFLTVARPEDINRIAIEIKEDLGNVFDVSYETPVGSGDSRKIDVKCFKKGVTLRAPKVVYFRQP